MTFRSVVPLAALAIGLLACDKSPPPSEPPAAGSATTTSSSAGTVRVSGSSALQPLVNAAKEKFEAAHRGASIEVSAGGSKKGIADVASQAVQIGDSDVFAPDDLRDKLVDHKVAVVGFAAMANKGPFNEKVRAVTLDQLARVFKGEIKDWKELGGEPQPIVVINRAAGSGTRIVFGNAVLGGDRFLEARTEDNSGALVAKLKHTKGAVSYLALSFVDDELRTLSLASDGGVVDPTEENITAGRYPIWSYEHMYTSGPPSGTTKEFLEYVLSPAFQKEVLPKVKGFIPVVDMKVTRSAD